MLNFGFYKGNKNMQESIKNWKNYIVPINKDGDNQQISIIRKQQDEKHGGHNGYEYKSKDADKAQG